MPCRLISFLVFVLLPAVAGSASGAEIDFNRDIRPILSSNCFVCHGPNAHDRKADLRLDTPEGAVKLRDGVRAIDPGKLAESELLFRIATDDKDELMPPPESHKVLSAEQKSLLKQWVLSGAEYKDHWAFLPPVKAEVPSAGDKGLRIHNPVDSFILRRLEKQGIPLGR